MGPGGPGLGGPGGPMGMAGGGQMASAAIRMGMEIDMQLKQLAQLMPLLQPWVQRIGEEMKVQLAQALGGPQSPGVPATGMSQFPDGSGRL